MLKKSLLYGIFFSLLVVSAAQADFEAVETILGRVENIQKEAQNIQEKIKEVQSAINEARQGTFGPLEELSGDLLKGIKLESLQPKNVAENADDIDKLTENIEKTMLPQYTDKSQDEAFIRTKELTDAAKRENISRFYALAFTTRTNMAKTAREKGNNDQPEEMTDSREMLRAINAEAMKSADQLNRILDMQLSIDEFALTDAIQAMSTSDVSKARESKEENK